MALTAWRRFTSHLTRGRRRGSHGSRSNHTRLNLETLDDRRMLAAGVLDPGFGTNGQVTTDFLGSVDGALSMAVQPDGKIVTAGQTFSGGGGSNFLLARYNPDGSLDSSFSFDGLVATDFAGDVDSASGVAIQPDGKIVAVGVSSTGPAGNFALARYMSDGTLDPDFGVGGKVVTDFAGDYDAAFSIAIQADGKLVVAGESGGGGTKHFAVARYNPDGTLDADFDADGKLVTDFAGFDSGAADVTIQADEMILVTGFASNGVDVDFALARYQADGGLDNGFGTGGKVLTDFLGNGDFGRSAAIQADGKIVVAGSAFNGADNDFALARYNPDGTLDADFEANGKLITNFGGDDYAYDVLVQPDGKIIAGGQTDIGGGAENFALARYYPDGTLDAGFSVDGKVVNDFAGGYDGIRGMALLDDGKILAAGSAFTSSTDIALARYLTDVPANPPTVESVVVGDGSNQRSMVTSLTVTFNGIVDVNPGAFAILQVGGGAVALNVSTSIVADQTVAHITFSGAGIIAGSLADGDYLLTIHGDAIEDSLGEQLDGDGDGTAGGDYVDEFFRLFGDSDGDHNVDKADRNLFGDSIGTFAGDPLFLAFFDFDGDGDIDRHDRKEFNKRFRKK